MKYIELAPRMSGKTTRAIEKYIQLKNDTDKKVFFVVANKNCLAAVKSLKNKILKVFYRLPEDFSTFNITVPQELDFNIITQLDLDRLNITSDMVFILDEFYYFNEDIQRSIYYKLHNSQCDVYIYSSTDKQHSLELINKISTFKKNMKNIDIIKILDECSLQLFDSKKIYDEAEIKNLLCSFITDSDVIVNWNVCIIHPENYKKEFQRSLNDHVFTTTILNKIFY